MKKEKTNKSFEEYVVNYYLQDKDIMPTIKVQHFTIFIIFHFLFIAILISYFMPKAEEVSAKIDAGYSGTSIFFETLGISGVLCVVFSLIFCAFIVPHFGDKTLDEYDKKIKQFCQQNQ